jgi:hypothetical protein
MQKIIGIGLLIVSLNLQAGFSGPTHHSRANCINNESISWDNKNAHNYAVVSFHTPNYLRGDLPAHRIETPWAYTRRQAAICWGEGNGLHTPNYYLVNGYHWEVVNNKTELQENTLTDYCSLGDGWFIMRYNSYFIRHN